MSYDIDIRGAAIDRDPVLFWTNAQEPFIISSQSVAQSGNIAVVRALKNDLIGSPMIVKFILATAVHITTWQGMAKNDPFATTTLYADFVTGYTVMFQGKSPIQYQNMVLRDGNLDIRQTIFDSGSPDYKAGLDFWQGSMNLVICT
jgi:hypothetical protein